jgi:hypothetical protein
MKREVLPRAPIVRVTLDREMRERLQRVLRDIFGCEPSGKVILNANAGGVLHAELEEKAPRSDKT